MANPIKRLNYFTGQFLEEPDFKAEQLYHERMRRMLAYATYTPGILNGLAVAKIDGGHVLVQKGFALDALENMTEGDQESRTIVITEDKIINLRSGADGRGFSDGDDVFLYLTFREDPTDGEVGKNTRFQFHEEVFTIKDTGAGFGLNTNLNILLGKVQLRAGDLTVMTPDATSRRQASLRLGGGVGPGPSAILVSISITPATVTLNVGNTQTFQATGMYSDSTTRPLTSADGLQWSSSNAAAVSINLSTGQASALAVDGHITITATVGTIKGTATVQVQAVVNAPVITNWTPRRAPRGYSPIIVMGSNLYTGAQVTFDGVDAAFLTGSTDIQILTGVPTAADGLAPNPNGKLRVSNAGGFAEVNFEIQV